MEISNPILPSVNFHLWKSCNMRCNFCFATFQDIKESILPKGHLTREESLGVVHELANVGFKKITFAGGEPTLCPWLPDLIKTAKNLGLTTMIVSNGSILNSNFLEDNKNHLDWIAISVDSLNPETNRKIGRLVNGKEPMSIDTYKSMANMIKHYGYGLKINTVVNNANKTEDMNTFIRYTKPQRWKVLQALSIQGQNDRNTGRFEVSNHEFSGFIDKHKTLDGIVNMVAESNDAMIGSYAMVDPEGRFFDDVDGKHGYSDPINKVGGLKALKQVRYNYDKFIERGGQYEWEKITTKPKHITLSGETA
ncbi:radical S-adenosyl methionine domain-containing protein 2 [Saccharicrinis carchari]|uniref:S-adenosylmethionine-dependent nucleotide dehydratase n=1 Tax=Saccharicrinis carchari TaxID=1168039 RepID=A0A521AY93_SACCC|nr:viperin family antiviral radical SAM protein [Saccharicrinis carchari]SMO39808.1 radical S-adenosyl methionine domain-containing protein 2 [Saccharicrinis carchari]